MLKRLHLKNFKGWEDTGSLELAPITVLFGSNSSGKTSLLQSLLLLKQTAASADRKRVLHTGDMTSLVDLGTPRTSSTGTTRAAWSIFSWRGSSGSRSRSPKPAPISSSSSSASVSAPRALRTFRHSDTARKMASTSA